jgi:hypothetical protein
VIESPFSPEFTDWALMSGYTMSFKDDAFVLGDSDEVREYVRHREGLWTLTRRNRNDPESFLMQATEVADIERFLTFWHGLIIRLQLQLPMLGGPGYTPEGMSPRYSLMAVAWAKVAVIDQKGETRAVLHGTTQSSADYANEFSWVADASLEDLRASMLDPGGLPLFPGCAMIQPT